MSSHFSLISYFRNPTEDIFKSTEKIILTKESFDGLCEVMLSKMMKNYQHRARARYIAELTEKQLEQYYESLAKNTSFMRAVQDYTRSSSAINENARKESYNRTIYQVDDIFHTLKKQKRLVFRFTKYDSIMKCPYFDDVHAINKIKVGDVVTDKGFISTSEHRRFLTNPPSNVMVSANFAILTNSGVNISKFSQYNNESEKKYYEYELKRLHPLRAIGQRIFSGPEAGQAEILLPRNARFNVIAIKTQRNKAYILLQDVKMGIESGGTLRDIYTGIPQ